MSRKEISKAKACRILIKRKVKILIYKTLIVWIRGNSSVIVLVWVHLWANPALTSSQTCNLCSRCRTTFVSSRMVWTKVTSSLTTSTWSYLPAFSPLTSQVRITIKCKRQNFMSHTAINSQNRSRTSKSCSIRSLMTQSLLRFFQKWLMRKWIGSQFYQW